MRRAMICVSALAILLSAVALPAVAGPYDPAVNIYGIHTWAGGANGLFNGKRGWTTEVIWTKTDYSFNLQVSQAQQIVNENFRLIIRLDWESGEPIPSSSANWDTFATQCAQKVALYKDYCNIWVIGNEMNANFLTSVPASTTVEVYRRCRAAIKAVQPNAVVVVAAVAPWNTGRNGTGPYSSAWLNYMYEMVNSLNAEADAYAIHAYGGRSGDQDPRDDDEMGFGVFKRWMEIIDANQYATRVPVLLTEFDHAVDGGANGVPTNSYDAGFINKAFESVNSWNTTHLHRIACACWFTYSNGGFPGYNISANSTMQNDFRTATSTTDYIGTVTGARDWEMFE